MTRAYQARADYRVRRGRAQPAMSEIAEPIPPGEFPPSRISRTADETQEPESPLGAREPAASRFTEAHRRPL